MNMKAKKDVLVRALQEMDFQHVFKIQENDGFTYLRAEQDMGNGRCIITIELGDRIYVPIHYCLGKLNNAGKKQKMLDLMNEFNNQNVALKFFLDEYDNIMCSFTYLVLDNDFNGNDFMSLTINFFKNIEESYYPQFMRLMWA